MSSDDWFRKRRIRFPFFDADFPGFYGLDIEEMMREFERRMNEAFTDIEKVPEKLRREKQLPDGSIVREMGPFVYGYSVTIGPDKKPIIREFGNIKPSPSKRGLTVTETRDPLVDVITEENQVKVIAEIPGVEKEDIKLHATEGSLNIHVESPVRPYKKEVEIPPDADPYGATSKYKNGILEVTFPRKREKKSKGVPIKLE